MKFQVVLLVLCSVIIVSQIGVNAEKKGKGQIAVHPGKKEKGTRRTTVAPVEKEKKFFGRLGSRGTVLAVSSLGGLGSALVKGIQNVGSAISTITGNVALGFTNLVCNIKFHTIFTTCCKPLPGPLVNLTELQTIANVCRSTADVFKIFVNYTLQEFNLLNNTDGLINLTHAIVAKSFAPSACFAECMFQKQGLISAAGVIDYDLAAKNLSNTVSSTWKDAVIAATLGCKTAVEDAKVKTISSCSTKPAYLLQCVRKTLYTSCPTQNIVNTPFCVAELKTLVKCPRFKLPFQ